MLDGSRTLQNSGQVTNECAFNQGVLAAGSARFRYNLGIFEIFWFSKEKRRCSLNVSTVLTISTFNSFSLGQRPPRWHRAPAPPQAPQAAPCLAMKQSAVRTAHDRSNSNFQIIPRCRDLFGPGCAFFVLKLFCHSVVLLSVSTVLVLVCWDIKHYVFGAHHDGDQFVQISELIPLIRADFVLLDGLTPLKFGERSPKDLYFLNHHHNYHPVYNYL